MGRRKSGGAPLTDAQHHAAMLVHLRSTRLRKEHEWVDRMIRWHDQEPAGPAILAIRDAVREGTKGGMGLLITPFWPEACLWAGLLDGVYVVEELLRGAVPHPDALVSDQRTWRRGTLSLGTNGFSQAVRGMSAVRAAFAKRFDGGLSKRGYPRQFSTGGVAEFALFVGRDGSRAAIARHPDLSVQDVRDVGMYMIGWMLRDEKPRR